MSSIKCPYCNRDAELYSHEIILEYKCNICGNYFLYDRYGLGETIGIEINNKVASFLFYNRDIIKNILIATPDEYKNVKSRFQHKQFNLITLDEIEAFWPRSFSEKISKILLWIDLHTSYAGQQVQLTHGDFCSLAFINNNVSEEELDNQYNFFINYFYHQKNYLNYFSDDDYVYLSLMPFGYERIEGLQLDKRNNKKVFVSMAFNDETKNTREAIRTGIVGAGYDATLIDEIIHNKQIVPEMFRLIRESRLLVMDISVPNYGAYYEAGYAQGLGKEVIITCSEERFYKKYETDEEKKYEKYLKPHFDIAQKQILLWKDTEDLSNKLKEWIKAIE